MSDIETIEETLYHVRDWAVGRIHELSNANEIEDAFSITKEFSEWLNSEENDEDIISIEYMSDWD